MPYALLDAVTPGTTQHLMSTQMHRFGVNIPVQLDQSRLGAALFDSERHCLTGVLSHEGKHLQITLIQYEHSLVRIARSRAGRPTLRRLRVRPHPCCNVRTTDEYVLGSGDQLKISVLDLEEYADKTVKIDPEGVLDLPLIGEVHAAGESLEVFKQELKRRLSRYIENPKVSCQSCHQCQPARVGPW